VHFKCYTCRFQSAFKFIFIQNWNSKWKRKGAF
jgi:hypothetical protein